MTDHTTSSTITTATPPSARLRGLDGLRALAVILVVVYHYLPFAAPGGFVGVDLFFVISGFLITTLLLRERDRHGRIRLGQFWARRARRLIPALFVVVTVCTTIALLIGGDVLVDMDRQVAGAATFSYNWWAIAEGSNYFSTTVVELFQNLWSLAVEEQFYLLWPLLVLLLLLIRRHRTRVLVVSLAALASAIWLAVLTGLGTDITRVYYGTDTHAFGLLGGAALAFALFRPTASAPQRDGDEVSTQDRLRALIATTPVRPGLKVLVQRVRPLVGVLGLAVILGGAWFLRESGSATFRWGLPAVALGAIAVIWSTVAGGALAKILDNRIFRAIGARSYGLYLWHWPVLVLLRAAMPDSSLSATVVPALLISLICTELSYRFIENPVRKLGYRKIYASFIVSLQGRSPRRFLVFIASAVTLILCISTVSAAVISPTQSSAQEIIEEGAAALKKPTASPTPSPTPSPTATATDEAVSPTDGTRISAYGDSVMLAAAPALTTNFPGIEIDAVVSRQLSTGVKIIREAAAAGTLRPVVVIAFGTNGYIEMTQLDQILRAIGPDRRLVVTTAYAPRDWIGPVNTVIRDFAHRHRQVELSDWESVISPRATELLAGDRIHPGHQGGTLFADTLRAALLLQDERLRESPHWMLRPGHNEPRPPEIAAPRKPSAEPKPAQQKATEAPEHGDQPNS